MPLPEVIDRYTIARLKLERMGSGFLKKEVETYERAMAEFKRRGVKIKNKWIRDLYRINGKIWDNEFPIRNEQEGGMTLAEIGRIAVKVRDLNIRRAKVKNEIVRKTGLGFMDVAIEGCGVGKHLK